MAGYAQFEYVDEDGADHLLSDAFVRGAFDLWFPFIEIGKPCNVRASLERFVQGSETEEDHELYYTFFHEYIHLIQSALYFVCQLPITFTHSIIYDIRVTAISRKDRGESRLRPLCFSKATNDIDFFLRSEYATIKDYRKPFSVVNILEGSARLLEERFRGRGVEIDHWRYSAIREISDAILPSRRLSDRELLDVCDVSLRRKNPAKAFVQLLIAIDKFGMAWNNDVYESITQLADKLGLERMPSFANIVIENSGRIFNSPLYAQYLRQVESLYAKLPTFFGGGRVFSLIYEQLSSDTRNGLPICLLNWISKCGSPVIICSDGRMEIFDTNIGLASTLDQNIIGIKSVVESIMKGDSSVCMMKGACISANMEGGCLPIDDYCSTHPWDKPPERGMLCPYRAIWRAFGLEGLRP